MNETVTTIPTLAYHSAYRIKPGEEYPPCNPTKAKMLYLQIFQDGSVDVVNSSEPHTHIILIGIPFMATEFKTAQIVFQKAYAVDHYVNDNTFAVADGTGDKPKGSYTHPAVQSAWLHFLERTDRHDLLNHCKEGVKTK